jgi:hypothetical protein
MRNACSRVGGSSFAITGPSTVTYSYGGVSSCAARLSRPAARMERSLTVSRSIQISSSPPGE